MGTVLQIIGGLVLIVIALIAIAAFAFWWKVRSILKQSGKLMEAMGGAIPKVQVDLNIIEQVPWKKNHIAQQSISDLMSLGFVGDGNFALDGMKCGYMSGFIHRDGDCVASVSELGDLGIWVDIVAATEEGQMLSASNREVKGDHKNPDYKTVVISDGAPAPKLYEDFREAFSKFGGTVRRYQAGDFKSFFEESYRRNAEWRYTHEDIRIADLVAMGEKNGFVVDPETQAFLEQKGMVNSDHLQAKLREAYFLETGVSAAEWSQIESKAFFITDTMYTDSVLDFLNDHDTVDFDEAKEAAQRMKDKRGTELFWALCSTLGVQEMYKTVYELKEPIPATLIVLNEDSERPD